MVNVLGSSAVDLGFEPQLGLNRLKLVFVASPRSGWLGIGIMCPSGATCLSTYCCFSDLALKKIQLSVMVYYKASDLIIISLKISLFSP
jgi:hypothetical protein